MITITKTPNADSRSATNEITIELLTKSTEEHISHVQDGLKFFQEKLLETGKNHDRTKLDAMPEFHKALLSGNVKDTRWYRRHTIEERHHLLSRSPDDVNLIDILEHLTDCVMAGMSRSGEIYDVDLSADLLRRAHRNTIELLKSQIQIEEDITNDQ